MNSVAGLIVLAYLVAVLIIGFVAEKKAGRSIDDFWVAGRRIGTAMTAFAIFSTSFSGSAFLGSAGYMLKNGIGLWLTLVAGVIVGIVFASLFIARQLVASRATTVTELLAARYNSKFVAVVTPLVVVITFTGYLVAQYKAAALVIQILLGLSYKTSVMLSTLVFVTYTALGGAYAVTWTDFLQGAMMLVVSGVVVLTIFTKISGPWTLLTQAVALKPVLGGLHVSWLTYLGGFLLNVCGFAVMPHILMRVYGSRDVKTARRSLNWAMLMCAAVALTYGVFAVSACTVRGIFPKDMDRALVILLEQFGPIILGVAVANITAAVMSSTDGALLAVAAAISQDIYRNVINPGAPDRRVIALGRIATLIVGVVSMVLAFSPPPLLVHLNQQMWGFLASGLFAPLVLGIWWKRANNTGAIAGIVGGTGLYVLLSLLFPRLPEYTPAIIGVPASFLGTVLGSILTPPPDSQVLAIVSEWHAQQ